MVIIISFIFSLELHSLKIIDASIESTRSYIERSFFTENKGQWDPEILFVGDTSFGKVAFTKDAIYYQMIQAAKKEKTYESQTIQFSFLSPLIPKIQGEDLLPHHNNYFIGTDPSKWATNCRNYTKIVYENIWDGINLVYYFTTDGMKYEYYLKPFAKIHDLKIKVEGAEIAIQGYSLQITTNLGTIQDTNLQVFDQSSGAMIVSNFNIQNNVFSFQDIPEKRNHTIVIDPLVYSTLLGTSHEDDFAYAVAVDTLGNSYIVGETYSTDFPVTPGSFKTTYEGEGDGVVFKLNPEGTILHYSTYLGGSGNDYARSITLDKAGNAYITGTTSSIDFPTTEDAYESKLKGLGNAFIMKFNSTGTTILYGTYLGGSDYDYAYGVAVDGSGNAYITGTTGSLDFPVTVGAYHTKNKGNYDAFISKMNATGTILLYSTYLGGSGGDVASAVALSGDYVYICGSTESSDFPTTLDAYQNKNNGGEDIFLVKLNIFSTSLLYSTYLGGSWDDNTFGIAIDNKGNAFITGETQGADFPVTKGSYWNNQSGESDIFISKFNFDLQPISSDSSTRIIIEFWIGYRVALVDGELIFLDTVPVLVDDTSVVPLRFIAESLKATVFYQAKTQEIDVIFGSDDITLWINKPIAQIESIRKSDKKFRVLILDVSPYIHNDRTLVPVRFITEAFGAEVEWNSKDQKITITLKK
jgi:hypothetical protein